MRTPFFVTTNTSLGAYVTGADAAALKMRCRQYTFGTRVSNTGDDPGYPKAPRLVTGLDVFWYMCWALENPGIFMYPAEEHPDDPRNESSDSD